MCPSPARALDIGVALVGLYVLWLGCSPGRFDWTPSTAPFVLASVLLGVAARLADWRSRRNLGDTFAAVSVVVVAGAVFVSSRQEIEWWRAAVGPNEHVSPSIFLALLAMYVAPTGVAVAGWTLGASTLPFVVGACAAGLVATVPAAPAVAVLGFTLARCAGTSTDEWLSPRQRPVLLGLGFAMAVVVLGVRFDTAARLWPEEARHADWPQFRVRVDEAWSFALRFGLELSVLASAFAFARGRAWGLLAVLVSGPMLVVKLLADDMTGRLPAWGGGCVVWIHPLGQLGGYMSPLILGLLVAVIPWLVPLGRALQPSADRA